MGDVSGGTRSIQLYRRWDRRWCFIFLKTNWGSDTNCCLSSGYGGKDTSQWQMGKCHRQLTSFQKNWSLSIRWTQPTQGGQEAPFSSWCCSSWLLAEAIHFCLLQDRSRHRMSNRKSHRVCRTHWVVLKKWGNHYFPLSQSKGETGTEAWLSTAGFFSWSALLHTLCRLFCRDAA